MGKAYVDGAAARPARAADADAGLRRGRRPGDPGARARASSARSSPRSTELSGATPDEVWSFFATGMLLNIVTALDLAAIADENRGRPPAWQRDARRLSRCSTRSRASPTAAAGSCSSWRPCSCCSPPPTAARSSACSTPTTTSRTTRPSRCCARDAVERATGRSAVAGRWSCSCGSARAVDTPRRSARSLASPARCATPASPTSSPTAAAAARAGVARRPLDLRARHVPHGRRRGRRWPSALQDRVEREPGVTAGGGAARLHPGRPSRCRRTSRAPSCSPSRCSSCSRWSSSAASSRRCCRWSSARTTILTTFVVAAARQQLRADVGVRDQPDHRRRARPGDRLLAVHGLALPRGARDGRRRAAPRCGRRCARPAARCCSAPSRSPPRWRR